MAKRPQNSYRFSLISSAFITVFIVLLNAVMLVTFTDEKPFGYDKIVPLALSVVQGSKAIISGFGAQLSR